MQDPPRPVEPLDYRPHSEDAAARRWPLWVGLAVTAVVCTALLFQLLRAERSSPPPAAVYIAPATQPAYPPLPAPPAGAATQPATDQSPPRN